LEIDKKKPVLVTGANGYVASWLVKRLLDEGMTVHAAVRNSKDPRKVSHLQDLAKNSAGKLQFFDTDLLVEGSYADAMKECELVYHTASPFTSKYKDPQRDLINPAVKGTENVLNEANRNKQVKRVVVTSSCAAIYTDAIDVYSTPNNVLTEDVWNTTSSLNYQPYSYSKVMAERRAWEIHQSQNQWDLVTINPSLVMGPALNADAITSESFTILEQFGNGTLRFGAPRLGIGVVDVRDVADAHIQAGFNPKAKGRYITSAHNTNFFEMAQTLRDDFEKDYPLPKSVMPKWVLYLFGPLMNKALNRKFIKNNVDVVWKADNSKIKRELGINFRPLKETMVDGFRNLIQSKSL
jgi:nucleoside-diphosphate-sugar epimerase